MTTEDVYFLGCIVLGALAAFLAYVVAIQRRDLDRAHARNTNLRQIHGRQSIWIRRRREQVAELEARCAQYVAELDALAEATRPQPVQEDLATAVQRDLDQLVVVEEPKPVPNLAPPQRPFTPRLTADQPTPGMVVRPRPADDEEGPR